jgi:iron complex outermembrane receptor protein
VLLSASLPHFLAASAAAAQIRHGAAAVSSGQAVDRAPVARTKLAEALDWLVRHKQVRVTYSADRVRLAQGVVLGDTTRDGSAILADILAQAGIRFRVTESGHVVLLSAAQQAAVTGTITGTVRDDSGAGLTGIIVIVRGTNRWSLTGTDGAYRIEGVPAGRRTVLVSEAFWLGEPQEVEVTSGGSAQADFTVRRQVFDLAPLVVAADPRYSSRSTISATKLPTDILDVPQSIQVVPNRLIEDQQALRVVDALRNVSGIAPEAGFGQTQDGFYVRGFQTQPVARNGFRRQQFGGYTDMANVERLEVLKGPASVLYGTGSPGGVVNVVTKSPRAEKFRALELTTGSRSFWRLESDMSGTMHERGLRYRFTGAVEQGGAYQNDADNELYLIAPSLEWQPNERLNVLFDGQWNRQRRSQLSGGGLVIDNRLVELPIERSLTVPYALRESEDRLLGMRVQYALGSGFAARLHHRRLDVVDDLVSTFLASPTEEDPDVWDRFIFASAFEVSEVYTQLELLGEFATGRASHRVLAGAERGDVEYEDPRSYFADHTPINIFNPAVDFTRPPWDGSAPGYYRAEQGLSGVYAQDLIAFGPKVDLLLGVRYDDVEFIDFSDRTNESSTKVSQTAWSPRFGLVFKPVRRLSLFTGWARSFDPTTRLDAFGDRLPPERGTQWEGGLKADIGGRATVTASVYQIVRDSIDIRVAASVDPRRVIPVGQETSKGFEIDVAGTLGRGWEGVLTYGFTDATITKDLRFPIGASLSDVPRHTASAWLTHTIQSGALNGLGFGFGLVHAGARPIEITEDPFELDPYTLAHGTLYYRVGRMNVSLNAKNLFDTRYFEATQGPNSNWYGAPRTLNLTVGVSF